MSSYVGATSSQDVQPLVVEEMPSPDLFEGLGKAMPDVELMFNRLATGWAVQIWALKKDKNNPLASVEGRIQALGPFRLFVAVLSERETVDNFGTMAVRETISMWPFAEDLDIFEKFCKDVHKQRERMKVEEWQNGMAGLEKVCGVAKGTFASLETQPFVETMVNNREEFHAKVKAAISSYTNYF